MWWAFLWICRWATWIFGAEPERATTSDSATIRATAEDGTLEIGLRDEAVLLMQDPLSPLLAKSEVRRARDHAASMFLWAVARSAGTDVDVTHHVQSAMASFFVPSEAAVTAEEFLRWCEARGARVDPTMEIVVVDKAFEEHVFSGAKKIAPGLKAF